MELRYFENLVFNRHIPWPAQIIGSCVASGAFRCLVIRSLIDTLLFGDNETRLGTQITGRNNIAPYAPWHYGMGRRYAGIRGRGDGSTCNGQIQALMAKGFLPCDAKDLTSDRYPEPTNTSLYRDYGAGQYLDKFAPQAIVFDLLESERVQSYEHTRTKLVDEYKPMMNCSGWAFRPDRKHRDGFWIYTRDRSNSWSHNLSVTGMRRASDNEEFVRIDNSWPLNAHRDGPHFYIRAEEDDRWARASMRRSYGDLKLRAADAYDLDDLFSGLREL